MGFWIYSRHREAQAWPTRAHVWVRAMSRVSRRPASRASHGCLDCLDSVRLLWLQRLSTEACGCIQRSRFCALVRRCELRVEGESREPIMRRSLVEQQSHNNDQSRNKATAATTTTSNPSRPPQAPALNLQMPPRMFCTMLGKQGVLDSGRYSILRLGMPCLQLSVAR